MKTALRVLNDLVAEKVIRDYAIGGAMGAMFYMEAVTTMDLDVFVVFNDDLNLLPLQPIYDALKAKGYAPDEHERECVNVAGTPVQFLPAFSPLLAEALEHARSFDYEGIPAKVLEAEYLAAICVQTGRMKDRLRVQMFLSSDGFDKAKFEGLLDKFGMSKEKAQWLQ